VAANKMQLSGVVAVVPVPFGPDEEIDKPAPRRLIAFASNIGLSAICLPAYGGEFYKLSDEERLSVVEVAVDEAAGRTLVIAQSNHGSAKVAASLARKNIAAGADLISLAIPRQFVVSDDSLQRYLSTVFDSVEVPCLLQDFNPGGPTVGVDFLVNLKSRCSNLNYVKLEEPLMAGKVAAIREALHDEVGILEGWGGLYLMELMDVGICGLMPGLGMADLLNRIYQWRRAGRTADALALFRRLLPHIVYSLQNIELFLYCEKRLLQARGLLPNALCRTPAYAVSSYEERYVEGLNSAVLQAIDDVSGDEIASTA